MRESWSDLVYIKFLQLAVDQVSRSPDTPVNVAAIWALDIVVGVPALGHDPIWADAFPAPFKQ